LLFAAVPILFINYNPKAPITANQYQGIALQDAIRMYNYLASHTTIDDGQVAVIVKNYYPGYTNYSNWTGSNPFLKVNFLIDPKAPGAGRPNGFLDIAGGIDVTKVVQALADFLSDRIKQGLTIAYLDKRIGFFKKMVLIREINGDPAVCIKVR